MQPFIKKDTIISKRSDQTDEDLSRKIVAKVYFLS